MTLEEFCHCLEENTGDKELIEHFAHSYRQCKEMGLLEKYNVPEPSSLDDWNECLISWLEHELGKLGITVYEARIYRNPSRPN